MHHLAVEQTCEQVFFVSNMSAPNVLRTPEKVSWEQVGCCINCCSDRIGRYRGSTALKPIMRSHIRNVVTSSGNWRIHLTGIKS
jgi:hypothetical protein